MSLWSQAIAQSLESDRLSQAHFALDLGSKDLHGVVPIQSVDGCLRRIEHWVCETAAVTEARC